MLEKGASFTRTLGFRLGVLLSIAILPIGMISILQTLHLSREAERSSEIAIQGRTAAAAAGERALLQGAIGTADALGSSVLALLDNPASCSRMMRDFVQRSATFVYAGFTDIGTVTEVGDGVTSVAVGDRVVVQETLGTYASHLAVAEGKLSVSDTVLSPNGQAFRRALLIQYPRAGSWTIAFQTGRPSAEGVGTFGGGAATAPGAAVAGSGAEDRSASSVGSM